MPRKEARKLPPLSFFREHAKVVLGSVLAVVVLTYILLPFVWTPRLTNSLLDRYAEATVRVGDSKDKLSNIKNTLIEAKTENENTTSIYKSKKANGITVRFVVNSRNRVVEAEYPLSLKEKVTLSDIGTQLPTSNAQEYWDAESLNTKLRVYPEEGFAIRYHEATKSVYTLYQFVPGNLENFITRNSRFSLDKPEETEEQSHAEPEFGSTFDLSVEIPNLDEPASDSAAPKIAPGDDLFLSR